MDLQFLIGGGPLSDEKFSFCGIHDEKFSFYGIGTVSIIHLDNIPPDDTPG